MCLITLFSYQVKMQNLNQALIFSVEKAAEKLLAHFQSQYGSLIFLPLGVNSATPKKIAPAVATSIENTLLQEKEGVLLLMMTDEKVGQIFDDFIESFFNSLNFIAKGVMKALGMKLVWGDFSRELAKNKTENPATYEKWKKNLMLVLEGVFDEIVQDFQAGEVSLQLTNGEITFSTVQEAVHQLKIFQ